MKKQKIVKKQNIKWQDWLTVNVLLFAWRFFTRLFFLSFYAVMAIPWILIFGADTKSGIGQILFRIAAFLSGNPDAQSLNEGDLGRAVIILFVVGDILYELYAYLRHKQLDSKFEAKKLKRRMYIQWIITIVGWTTLAVVEYDTNDPSLSVVLFGLGIISCAFFWMEYSFKIGFQALKKTFLG